LEPAEPKVFPDPKVPLARLVLRARKGQRAIKAWPVRCLVPLARKGLRGRLGLPDLPVRLAQPDPRGLRVMPGPSVRKGPLVRTALVVR
jgi:hypothetical protein